MSWLLGQGLRGLLALWPLGMWLLAWQAGGWLAEGTVLYRAGQVTACALLVVPAALLALRHGGPGWLLPAAALGAMVAGGFGLAAETERLGAFYAAAGSRFAALLPHLDYPLVGVSLLALAGPGLVLVGRAWDYRRSGRASGRAWAGLLGSAHWMTLREARRSFAEGDLVIGEAYAPARQPWRGGRAPLLRFTPRGHLLTVAGSGAGKTTSVAVPNCLSWTGSLVVHDPKGELARLCGPKRRAMGREVFVLDPLDPDSDSLNVLDWLDPSSERLIDEARAVVSWLTDGAPPAGENKIFEENARELVLTLLLLLVGDPRVPAAQRHLAGLRDYFYQPNLREFLGQVGEHANHIAFGVPAQNARVFQGYGERLWGSVLGTAKELLAAVSSPPMARLVSGGGGRVLGLDALAGGQVDVFVSIPVKDLDANPAVARLLLGTLLNAAYEAGRRTEGKQRMLFLLDEMPRLRRMPLLETARDIGRGYGLTLWAIVQDLGQLERHYGREGVVSWLENSQVKTFFGIGEQSTAERLAATIGQHTVTARSRSWSHPFAAFTAKSDAPQARALITADEVMRMAVDERGLPDEQIVLLRSHAPLRCGLAKYYRREEFKKI